MAEMAREGWLRPDVLGAVAGYVVAIATLAVLFGWFVAAATALVLAILIAA